MYRHVLEERAEVTTLMLRRDSQKKKQELDVKNDTWLLASATAILTQLYLDKQWTN